LSGSVRIDFVDRRERHTKVLDGPSLNGPTGEGTPKRVSDTLKNPVA